MASQKEKATAAHSVDNHLVLVREISMDRLRMQPLAINLEVAYRACNHRHRLTSCMVVAISGLSNQLQHITQHLHKVSPQICISRVRLTHSIQARIGRMATIRCK